MCCGCSCKSVHVLTSVHCVCSSIFLIFPFLSLCATRDAFCRLLASALVPFHRMCPALQHSHPEALLQLQWFRDRFDLSAQFCSREIRGDLAIVEG